MMVLDIECLGIDMDRAIYTYIEIDRVRCIEFGISIWYSEIGVYGHDVGPVLESDLFQSPASRSGQFFFVPKDLQCSKSYAKTFFQIFCNLWSDKISISSCWA